MTFRRFVNDLRPGDHPDDHTWLSLILTLVILASAITMVLSSLFRPWYFRSGCFADGNCDELFWYHPDPGWGAMWALAGVAGLIVGPLTIWQLLSPGLGERPPVVRLAAILIILGLGNDLMWKYGVFAASLGLGEWRGEGLGGWRPTGSQVGWEEYSEIRAVFRWSAGAALWASVSAIVASAAAILTWRVELKFTIPVLTVCCAVLSLLWV